jgi:hypothetical protein
MYYPHEVVGHVSHTRRQLNLPPYTDKIRMYCERDFYLVFMVEEVFEVINNNGRDQFVLKGYKPRFQILPMRYSSATKSVLSHEFFNNFFCIIFFQFFIGITRE